MLKKQKQMALKKLFWKEFILHRQYSEHILVIVVNERSLVNLFQLAWLFAVSINDIESSAWSSIFPGAVTMGQHRQSGRTLEAKTYEQLDKVGFLFCFLSFSHCTVLKCTATKIISLQL